ncbi:MAG: DUF58 domain-containing protein [Candidatus Eremiobacteraeota bacterium]|nr:DUF58 domain-containing protein [Candidatus Eremiobacteraeota bacterium]
MREPARVEQRLAPPIGLILLLASAGAAAYGGAGHRALLPLVVFVVAFPVVWVFSATILSVASARALRLVAVDAPARMHAMGSFRMAVSFALGQAAFPAVGTLTSARFSNDEVTIENGPWCELPILEPGRAATSSWEVLVKQRGRLFVGPFRASVEIPGSAIRATAVFDTTHAVTVLPAEYQLQPFADALLAGRHVAVGRYQKLPTATEEYVGAREYRPGDSPKLIHRVLSLRTRDSNDFYVREFQDPSRDDLCLVLDTAPPLDGDEALHLYRLEKAVCFVGALCRVFAARRLTVRFVCQRGARNVLTLRVRPLDADLDHLETELAHLRLRGDRATLGPVLMRESRRHGAAVIFVSLRPRETVEQQRLHMVTLTPDHVPVFTREVVA